MEVKRARASVQASTSPLRPLQFKRGNPHSNSRSVALSFGVFICGELFICHSLHFHLPPPLDLPHIPKGAAPAAGLLARPRRAAHRPWNDHGTPAGSLKNTDRAKSAEPFVPFFAMARRSYLMLLLVIFVCGTDHLIQARKKKKAKRGCGAEKEDCEQHEDCCYPMMCTSPGTTENGDELPLGK